MLSRLKLFRRLTCMPRALALLGLSAAAAPAFGVELGRRIPDEYETTSPLGGGLNNAGYAATDPHAAVRANPALLSLQRAYSVEGGYHWPSAGREYFQAGVVDSKTASVAAGVSYTGYNDDYLYPDDKKATPEDAKVDSPIIRRGVIGLAQPVGAVSIGVGATYVEANPLLSSSEDVDRKDRVRGFGLNAGVAGVLGAGLRAGVSAENMSNKRINDYVPPTYRGGVAYSFSQALTGFLDYRQRERVIEFEAPTPTLDAAEPDDGYTDPEQMALASFSASLQDSVKLLGSYGYALSEDHRRSLAGGVAVGNEKVSLSYTVSRPYLASSETHQAVALSVDMSM